MYWNWLGRDHCRLLSRHIHSKKSLFVLSFAQMNCCRQHHSPPMSRPLISLFLSRLCPYFVFFVTFPIFLFNLITIMHLFAINGPNKNAGQVLWPVCLYTSVHFLQYNRKTEIVSPSADDPSEMSLLRLLFFPLTVCLLQQTPLYRVHYLCIACILCLLFCDSIKVKSMWKLERHSFGYLTVCADFGDLLRGDAHADDDDGHGEGEEEKGGKAVKKQRCTLLDHVDDGAMYW